MRVIDLENINEAMRNETAFVLHCEEVFHDKISSAAAAILANRSERPVVTLTGPSGSGKTTTAMRLKEYLERLGVKVCLLSMDNSLRPAAGGGAEGLGIPLVRQYAAADLLHQPADGRQRGGHPLVRFRRRSDRRL